MNNKVKAALYYIASLFMLLGVPVVAEAYLDVPHITFTQFVTMAVAVMGCSTFRDIASSWWNFKSTPITFDAASPDLENQVAEAVKNWREKIQQDNTDQ